MRKSNVSRRLQSGFTLLELSLSIVVALVLGGIAIGMFATTNDGAKGNSAQTQLMTVTGVLKGTAQAGLYNGVTQHVLASTGKIPAAMVDSTTPAALKIVNAYGGNFAVASASPYTTADITMDKVTTAGCTDLVLNTQANYYAVKIGSVSVKSAGGAAATQAAVATECNKSNANTIVFTVSG